MGRMVGEGIGVVVCVGAGDIVGMIGIFVTADFVNKLDGEQAVMKNARANTIDFCILIFIINPSKNFLKSFQWHVRLAFDPKFWWLINLSTY
jgi:hypothetical protein